MIPPWWERYPGLYQFEVDELRAAGFTVDEGSPAGAGPGPVRLRVSDGPGPQLGELLVTFPDLYPWYRFEVQTLDGDWLGRHHHPFGRTLCLIGRSTDNWHHDTVAAFLTERLPKLVAAAAAPESESTVEAEEHAGEPFSDYFEYQPNAVIMLDGACSTGDANGGSLDLLVEKVADGNAIRGIVHTVRDRTGADLGTADARLAGRPGVRIGARWQRLNEPPVAPTPAEILKIAAVQEPALAVPSWQAVGTLKVDVVAVVFPEETQWRTLTDGWIIICRTKGTFSG